MTNRWGFGWMGSKNKIAEDIVRLLPASECLVDLFAGGCAITHCAMLSGKWQRFIANDLKGTAVFFKEAIEGKVENLYEWVSREDFVARRDHDVKVAAAWSFGNTGDAYLYSQEIEPLKRAMYDATFGETHEARRVALHAVVREIYRYLVFSDKGAKILASWAEERRVVEQADDETKKRLEHILVMEARHTPQRQAFDKIRGAQEPRIESFNVLSEQKQIERLEHIERLQQEPRIESFSVLSEQNSLMHLEHMERLGAMSEASPCLTVYDVDYRKVPIPAGAVVYADPPYTNTQDYGMDFDSSAFWQWVDAQPFPVFVSEYEAPAGFSEVWSTNKRCVLASAAGAKQTTERLFVQARFADTYRPKAQQAADLFAGDELLEATA